ncbi:hypothetical protein [Paenarthrobacter nitroguajacolicus]|uniref:hypothetical protein n=1 Tax=Paenarthrobacter nitroguajacolicus TaxID=211146 RepID=UPI00248AE279|nr:hypothetical protein [Paenarthrobacter nitroguajacolicus]MDI2033096.1 hypothetical protein [Paenarthrobacter nitroguajacolicus]
MLLGSGWRLTTSDGHSLLPSSRRGLAKFEVFAVWPVDGVRINFFTGPDGVFFDLDLREFINQATVDGIAHALRKLGATLLRDVVIRDEGSSGAPVIRYTVATDQFALS